MGVQSDNMPKIYTDTDVLTAAFRRFDSVFSEFDNCYLSVSGGKDSSVMLQLAAMRARTLGKKFSVLYIDLEAQYQATIQHIENLVAVTSDVVDRWYWIAMPLSLRNSVSVIQPKWICWDKNDINKWVRPMPLHDYVINEDNYPAEWTWFNRGMEFEDFILYFARWFNEQHGGITGCGVAIRSDESLNRFRTIISTNKEPFNNLHWTTRSKICGHPLNVYNFYPIYDWRTEDIWGAVSKFGLIYNDIYELMYKNGVSIHEQRLCQPYGDDQRNGLDQFRFLEPETWELVLNRVHGVNFGNIYCRTSLLGNIKTEKPNGMTWEQYTVFLLESLGLYAPELRDHYYRKIKTFLKYYEDNAGQMTQDIPEELDPKIEASKKQASWRRIARAIERNDFWMKRLSFSQTKGDVVRLFELKKKYKNLIFPGDTDDKHLRNLAERMIYND